MLRRAVNAEVDDHPRSQTQRGVQTVFTETFAMNFERLAVSCEFDAYINSAVHKKVNVPGSISRIAEVWANGRPKRKRNNCCPANRYGGNITLYLVTPNKINMWSLTQRTTSDIGVLGASLQRIHSAIR